MCSVSNRLVIVDTDSSVARMPLPAATSARAVSSRLCFVTSPSYSTRERSIPELHRGRVAIVAEDVQGRGVEQEVLAGAGRQTDPAGDQHAKNVAVSEQRDVARRRADARQDPVDPRADLRRSLAARTAVTEDHPARRLRVDLLGREPLVLAVVPFLQVRLEHCAGAETGQLAGLARP